MRGQLWTVTEVPCEGNGSLLHSVWAADQKQFLQEAWARVYLKQAQILGLGSDVDKFIASVVVKQLGPRAHAPALQPGARPDNAQRGFARARNKREPASIRHARANSIPLDAASATAASAVDLRSVENPFVGAHMDMPPTIAAAFARLYARDREQCAPLPRYKAEPGDIDLAGSVLRDRLSEWMQSEDGRKWEDHEPWLTDDADF